jgi:flagellin
MLCNNFICYNSDMTKTLELALAKAAALPEAAQERIAYELLERIDTLSALKAAIDEGIAELDATVTALTLDGTKTVTTYSGIDANGNATTVAAAVSLGVSVTTTPPSGATAGLLTQGAYNLNSLGTGNSTQVSSANASATLTAVGAALQAVTGYSALIGATQDRMTAASTLNSSLTTNYALGVSALVDADMNVASTHLQALQTQQKLGIQSLSIANQNSQLILKLFQ